MDIYNFISNNRQKIESAYDLAALCYDYLLRKIKKIGEENFITQYLLPAETADQKPSDASTGNPNLEMLQRFADDVSNTLLNDYLEMEFLLDEVLDYISSAKQHMQKFGYSSYNEATIAYYLLMGINLYAGNSLESNKSAPLNTKYQTNAYVYCFQSDGIIATNIDMMGIGDRILPLKIRNDFQHLIILEKKELRDRMNPPKMVTLVMDENHAGRDRILHEHSLNVAVIPFGRKDICKDVPKETGGFRIEYTETHRKKGIDKAIKLLDRAIEDGANIIVFPEYVCFPAMQEAIGGHLQDLACKKPDVIDKLLLVVTGSGWTPDDNNVSQVFSGSGCPLGKHYKCETFHKHKVDTEKKNTRHIVEGLQNPGKESVIIEIPKLGSVMTAICRDVSNRGPIEALARVFRTDFLMVPAWSDSLHKAFEDQLCNITSANGNTCSVVCNGCGGIEDKHWDNRRDRGIVVMPCKNQYRIVADSTVISVEEQDWPQCSKCRGCLFSLSLYFSIQDIENGKKPTIRQIF